ncbi:unnamed protein product [Spirodela intermedia]|uniref:Uncharacterized protein n=2 Tax=Spirodela intermedia TaxID=51605 RepID=A0A7I8I8C3_SPIIN|nr:unnamed protein product [Spirodela intermedia]CAA6653916.1 unnamed protein product [Spirodela intermedia]CAA7388350.1 unnamed protein product [Spirodela intermedia]
MRGTCRGCSQRKKTLLWRRREPTPA